jgi:Flp pilus assembly protein TadD
MPTSSEDLEPPAPPRRAANALRRLAAKGGREHWWDFLDYLDRKPGVKRLLVLGIPAAAAALALGAWGYQRWSRVNSVRIARQWLQAGRLDRAAAAVQNAIAREPGLASPWRLASELAWRKGNPAAAVEYARKAAAVSSYDPEDVVAWAEASILANDMAQAREAQAHLDPDFARASARALRVEGEIARRDLRFSDARTKFEAALEVDSRDGVQVLAVDEVPLGIVCLQSGSQGDLNRGRALLSEWAADPSWGIDALRALLEDARVHRNTKAIAKWAEALRVHPRCTLADVPVCLQAFASAAPDRFRAVLDPLEERSRRNPTAAAQLLGWLNEIGQGSEAIRFGASLDPALARKPPVVLGIAEAHRSIRDWDGLRDWVDHGDWGRDLGFVGWAYGFDAAKRLGDQERADSFLQSVLDDARSNPAHALFAGDSLYAWGYPKESAQLLWLAADHAGQAFEALGSLCRLYEVQRDAEGQYRAFSRLRAMRPADLNIANNLAYFGALTDLGSQEQVKRIADSDFRAEPENITFRSTYAFVLVWSGQSTHALALMEPVSHYWRRYPAVAFAYGSALAAVGRKSEAKQVLDSLDARGLDPMEADWIAKILG